jgi:hypothetical protein
MRRAAPHVVAGLSVALVACSSSHGDAASPSSDAGVDAAGSGAGCGAAVTESDAGTLVAVPLTACVPSVYAAELTIGGSQPFELLLDMGSTTLAVAAAGPARRRSSRARTTA